MQMVSAATSVRAPTGDPSTVVERQGPRLVGERRLGGAATPIEMDVPDAVTLADGIELALWASPLEVGRVIRLPVVNLVDGTVRTVVATVEERVELTVAAGSFDTFRVVIDGDDPQIYHVLAEGPHIPIRMESASRPVALELTSPPALVRLR